LIYKRYFNYDIKISLYILVFLRATHVVESKSCSLHSLTALVRLDTPLRPSRSLLETTRRCRRVGVWQP